jgi:hypothetical protein
MVPEALPFGEALAQQYKGDRVSARVIATCALGFFFFILLGVKFTVGSD